MPKLKKLLFIDRDGTLITEPEDEQIDAFDKLNFYPGVLEYLPRIASELDYTLILVSNQDGLGTPSYPEAHFHPVHDLILRTFKSQGVVFSAEHIDRTFPHEHADTRKPGTGMLKEYFNKNIYDLEASFVIGDRINDCKLAENLGAKAIWLNNNPELGIQEHIQVDPGSIALSTNSWEKIYAFLRYGLRKVHHERNTRETQICIDLNLDGTGQGNISTGLGFFDHMLDQLARHGGVDLALKTQGDLHIDEHHTIEDTGIALGEAFAKALGNKLGIDRYGFALPMDDCLAQVALDFGGRSELVWKASFKREKIGDMPTELFDHFFKSFCDGARCNLNIQVEGENEHHKIESIFKAWARCIRMGIRRDLNHMQLPSTKGIL